MPTKKRFTEDSYQREPWFKALAQAMLTAKNEQDMSNLLGDLGALSELQAWSERLEVAKHLVKGLSYRQVAAATGASTTTVTRVARAIENGTGGYRKLLSASRHHRMMKGMIKKVDQEIPQPENKIEQSKPVEKTPEPKPASLLQKYLP
jgi:TrpR-related protein YerC/YecD